MARFIITGGGTGGHLAVAEALAQQLLESGEEASYVGSSNGMDRHWFGAAIEEAAACGASAKSVEVNKDNARANSKQKQIDSNKLFKRQYFLPSKGFVNLNKFEQIIALICLCISTLRAVFILLKERPRAVISVGGYSALPTALAAALLRRPLFLHEQNSRMGLANRICARFAREVICAYAPMQNALDTAANAQQVGAKQQAFAPLKSALANCLAQAFLPQNLPNESINFAAKYAPYPLRNSFMAPQRARSADIAHLLVLGGSAGASVLNDWAILLAPQLNLRGINLWHQCGRANLQQTIKAYTTAGIWPICLDENLRLLARAYRFSAQTTATTSQQIARSWLLKSRICTLQNSQLSWPSSRAKCYLIAFCSRMHELYLRADFAISRAGASAMAELLAARVPTLFVPYAHAASNHQFFNAISAVQSGCALLCEQGFLSANQSAACQALLELLTQQNAINVLNTNLRARANPNGASVIIKSINGILA